MPPAAYGTGYAPYPVAARRHRATLIVVLALVVVMVLAGAVGGAMYVNNIGPFKDSGLAMCERMRDAKQTGDTFPVPPTGRMTEDNYRQLRGDFADSRYADIRDAGTRFVDLLWQLSGGRPADMLGMVLMLSGPIIQSYSSLSGACTAHGVTIPPLTGR